MIGIQYATAENRRGKKERRKKKKKKPQLPNGMSASALQAAINNERELKSD